MLTIQQKIADEFLAELGKYQDDVKQEQVERLRQLLASGRRIKPDEFVEVFMEPGDEEAA